MWTFSKETWGPGAEKVELEQESPPFGWTWDRFLSQAGFDPEDEEVEVCRVQEDFGNVLTAGDLIVTGLTSEGHDFCRVYWID